MPADNPQAREGQMPVEALIQLFRTASTAQFRQCLEQLKKRDPALYNRFAYFVRQNLLK